MGARRGGRGLDPETALRISIEGTAGRLVDERTPTVDAVEQLRALAGDRADVLAEVAGSMIGGFLGHPLNSPLVLPAAYLLTLAANGAHHAELVAAADTARRNAGGSAYSL